MSDQSQQPSRLAPNPDVIEQDMDGQLVLFHLQTNQLYQLNTTAARFWELIQAGHNLAEIKTQLLTEFDVSPEQLDDELRTMTEMLQEQKLVTVDDPQ
ncbi:MAG: PqqD family protein [Anaerolineae bacterium]|nr:PqqD family protein [Anaerolineae bacterium]